MCSCNHLSEEDVHRIAYLTMHGWVLSYDGWEKEGFTHTKENTQSCGCCIKAEITLSFDLEDAYWAQREASDD
jgi:hypothetical protein